jgi:hypothetical protein
MIAAIKIGGIEGVELVTEAELPRKSIQLRVSFQATNLGVDCRVGFAQSKS